jgi:hypothetical protein
VRLVNRLLGALLAVALVVIGVLIVVEVIAYRVNDQKPAIVHWHHAYAWAARTTWRQGSVRVTCVVLVVLGLALLLSQLKPSRVSRLLVKSDVTDAAYTRRGVAAALRTAVIKLDGVHSAKVSVTHRRVRVDAISGGSQRDTAQTLKQPITEAARQRLDSLELATVPALSVHVKPRSS